MIENFQIIQLFHYEFLSFTLPSRSVSSPTANKSESISLQIPVVYESPHEIRGTYVGYAVLLGSNRIVTWSA